MPPRVEWRRLAGNAIQCVVEVTVAQGDRYFTDYGDCDSFDPFLAKRKAELQKAGASPEQITEILKIDLQKKAYANALSRAISGWLGIRGLSWESLEQLGLDRSKAGRIEFKRGAAGGEMQTATCAEAAQLPIGSKFAIRAFLSSGRQLKGKNGKAYCLLNLTDETGELPVTLWAAKPEGLASGSAVYLPQVEVREYRGEKQYSASKIEVAEAPDEVEGDAI